MINEDTIVLKDNRLLGFSEYGDSNGKPVFYFHGSGSSRLDHPADISILKKIGIRLITTDRPGHGLSGYDENRTLLDFADNISELASYLNIKKFYVLGHSAGGPYALACTYKLRDKIIKCGVVSGLAPFSRPKPYQGLSCPFKILMFLIRNFPKINFILRKQMTGILKLDDKIIAEKLITGFPPEDQKHLKIENNADVLVKAIKEGYRQGYAGPARDDIVINQPWNFDISEIDTPTIIWHGCKDKNVPFKHGEYQHSLIRGSKFYGFKDEAHMFILSNWEKILIELTE